MKAPGVDFQQHQHLEQQGARQPGQCSNPYEIKQAQTTQTRFAN